MSGRFFVSGADDSPGMRLSDEFLKQFRSGLMRGFMKLLSRWSLRPGKLLSTMRIFYNDADHSEGREVSDSLSTLNAIIFA